MSDIKYFLDETSDPKEDGFGIHTNIAKAILNIITNSNQAEKHSFTFGLFGRWGSGKSYIVNRIQEELEHNEAIFCFNIDAWKFVENPLYRMILLSIEKQSENNPPFSNKKLNLKKKLYESEAYHDSETKWHWSVSGCICVVIFLIFCVFFVYSLCNSILPYWQKTNSHIDFLSLLVTIIKELIAPFIFGIGAIIWGFFYQKEIKHYSSCPTFSAEQFEEIFKKDIVDKIIEHNEKAKIVFIFDNIDRCEPDCAYETLTAIKTFMNQPNCLYIIPCDDNAIKDHLESKMSASNNKEHYASEFVDKIFNTYFRIPEIKIVDKDTFIENNLKELKKVVLGEDDIRDIKQIMYHAYKVNTPRQIKRFINDFAMYYYIAQEVDEGLLDNKVLFAIMIAIKQKWQFMESDLIEDSEYFKKYYGDEGQKAQIKTIVKNEKRQEEYNKCFEFLDAIKSLRSKFINTPLEKYVYLKKVEDRQIIKAKLEKGEKIDLSNDEQEYIIINEATKMKEDSTFKNGLLKSLILTTKDYELKKQKKPVLSLISEITTGLDGTDLKDFLVAIGNDSEGDYLLDCIFNVKEIELSKLCKDDETVDESIEFKIFEKFIAQWSENSLGIIFQDSQEVGIKNAPILNKWVHKKKYINSIIENHRTLPQKAVKELIETLDVIDLDLDILKDLQKMDLNKDSKEALENKLLKTIRDYGKATFGEDHDARIKANQNLLPLFELAHQNSIKSLMSDDEIKDLGSNSMLVLSYYLKDAPVKPFKDEEDKELYFKRLFAMSEYFSDDIEGDNINKFTTQLGQVLTNTDCKDSFVELVTIDILKNIFKIPEAKIKILEIIAEDLYNKFEAKILKENYELLLNIPINAKQLKVYLDKLKQNKSGFTKIEKFIEDNSLDNQEEILKIIKDLK